MELTIAGVVKESIVDGPGIRYTVFTQGCPHHCPGCHNPQTWAFEGGQRTTPQALFEDFQKDPILKGVTFSGGEPFCQPEPLTELAKLVHGAGKDVACYTGWTYEQLLEKGDPAVNALLAEVDLLIDGPFVLEQRNPGAALPGQREPAAHQHEGDPQAGPRGAGGRGIAA